MDNTILAAIIGAASGLLGVWLKHYLETTTQQVKKSSEPTEEVESSAVRRTPQFTGGTTTSLAANISLVCGILTGLLVFPVIPAIVAGHMALKQIRCSNGRVVGVIQARIGLVLGYGFIALLLLYFPPW